MPDKPTATLNIIAGSAPFEFVVDGTEYEIDLNSGLSLDVGDSIRIEYVSENRLIVTTKKDGSSCPECGSTNLRKERRMEGYTECLDCGRKRRHDRWNIPRLENDSE